MSLSQWKGCAANVSAKGKLLLWFGIMCLSTMLMVGLWYLVCDDKTSTISLKYFQALQMIGTLLIPPICIALCCDAKWGAWLKLDRQPNWGVTIVSMLLMCIASPAINMLGYWNQQIQLPECMAAVERWMEQQEKAAEILTERFIIADSFGVLLVNLGLMAVLPAFSEELTFRGVLIRLLGGEKHTIPHLAIWVVALVFSAVHCQFEGFIPRMLMGAWLGYMLYGTKCMWVPILMHLVNNATAVISYNIVRAREGDTHILEQIGTGDTLWLGIASAVIVIAGSYFILRRSTTINNASSRMSIGN